MGCKSEQINVDTKIFPESKDNLWHGIAFGKLLPANWNSLAADEQAYWSRLKWSTARRPLIQSLYSFTMFYTTSLCCLGPLLSHAPFPRPRMWCQICASEKHTWHVQEEKLVPFHILWTGLVLKHVWPITDMLNETIQFGALAWVARLAH